MKKNMKNILPKWSSKNIRNGSYSIGAIALVIAIAIVLNLVINKLPSQYRLFDMSQTKLKKIGEKTEQIVKALEEDVTIYQIVEGGEPDYTLQTMLERYESLSSHIKVEIIDPVLKPNFLNKYEVTKMYDNSLIVESEKRFKVIDYYDMYERTFDYTTYTESVTSFDGEGQVTSAIAYVTTDNLPVIYTLTGHEEPDFTDSMKTAIAKSNIETKELNLLTVEAVPEDADCVLIFSPSKDITADEADKLIAYLENGGNAFIISAYIEEELPNLQRVLNNYGIGTMEGLILEGSENHYVYGNPTYILPELQKSDVLGTLSGSDAYVLLPFAQAVAQTEDKRSTVEIESLMKTSDSAYIKTDLDGSVAKEAGDLSGSFDVAVAVTETVENGETQMIYVTTPNLLTESVDAMVGGNNLSIFTNGLSWMCEVEQSVSIAAKSTQLGYLTVTASSGKIWSVVTIGIIPVSCLLLGGLIWFKRRRR